MRRGSTDGSNSQTALRVASVSQRTKAACSAFTSQSLAGAARSAVRTAKAKGIGRFLVINKHALRNALIPIITVIGMEIPVLFGGQVIIEQVFSWPGLGLMTMSAITNRDYPVIMGVCLLSAIVVLAANLITDILYALADPTIQLK